MRKLFNKTSLKLALALGISVLALTACGGVGHTPTRGIYMLLDTSGTYTKEIDKAQQIISYLLTNLQPGDSMAVARIDTASFSEKDIIAQTTFADRPSEAERQKRAFVKKVRQFVNTVHPSAYTDITGGVLQGIGWLDEIKPDQKIILIFSDMKEELPKGYVRNIPLKLKGFQVLALNVTKLRSDNVDPREYLGRVASWGKRVEDAGGHWRVINDLERLENILPSN
ncbi:MAG TPA: VWA domain-containing protein [Gammaproteobacteria bacterium]|nr:VWA domain-containing protein [Gammaproteobacteria bacterium]